MVGLQQETQEAEEKEEKEEEDPAPAGAQLPRQGSTGDLQLWDGGPPRVEGRGSPEQARLNDKYEREWYCSWIMRL